MTVKTATKKPTVSTTSSTKSPTTTKTPAEKKPAKKTTVRVKFDAGFSNTLFIRGEGAGLSWFKGTPLKNVSHDEWVWETAKASKEIQFKLLINDEHFESGENHRIGSGGVETIHPHF